LIAVLLGASDGWIVRGFSVAPLQYLGKLSYGAYLWHWPLFCVLTPERLHWSWPAVHCLRFSLTLLVATLSLRFVETPIRRGKLRRGAAWLALGATSAAALSYAVTLPRFNAVQPLASELLAQGARVLGARPSVFSVPFQELPSVDRLPEGTTRVLVLGDSVANKLGTAMRYRQEEFNSFVAERGVGNCSILKSATGLGSVDGPRDCAATWLTDLEQLRPDATFLVLGGGFLNRLPLNDGWVSSCSPEFEAAYTARLTELIASIRPLAGRLWMARVPYPVGRWRGRDTLATVDCFNRILERALQPFGVEWVDLMQHVCPTSECRLLDAGSPIRPDGLHFDGAGTENTARFALERVVGKRSAH
jgi:lysophospholipase L1-like esterase